MLLCALNPLQETTGTSSMPALLEDGHGIVHFQETFQGHTDRMNNNLSWAHKNKELHIANYLDLVYSTNL